MRVNKWWWIAGVALAGVGVWVLNARNAALRVDTVQASVGPIRVTIEESGTTRVRDHADVSAPVTGRWVPAGVHPGDAIRGGTTLGTLYPAPMDVTAQQQAREHVGAAQAAWREAETRVTAARTAVEEAQRSLGRAQRLGDAGAVSPQDVERARDAVTSRQSEYDGARMRVEATAHDLQSARAAVSPVSGDRNGLRITAPVGGQVLRVTEEHERVVMPGTLLVEVGDPRGLEVLIPLLTSDAAHVRVGAAVDMTMSASDAARPDTLHGLVARIEPSAFTKISALGVEEQRVNLVVTLPSAHGPVGDQYRVRARITIAEVSQALRVPTGALVRDGAGWVVYAVRSGRAVRLPVSIGERSDTFAEVRSGLNVGDAVVLYPGDRLRDGMRVTGP